MKVSRDTIDEKLRTIISQLTERQQLYMALDKEYNIPVSISADICSNRRDIGEFNDFICYAFLSQLKPKLIPDYFTDREINAFSVQKYEERKQLDKVEFHNMIRITDDQWIGSITVKQLMKLKDAQLIKYNENTQRTLQRVVRGENRYYKIFLDKTSVSEIKGAFENNAYIPDDITLNVPIEEDEYDPERLTITFKPPKMMDILDGYHRYIAISQAVRDNPDFDYTMEIRIVSFSEEKAKQFIYQKDQKTKMKKINSDSLNQYSPANIVVDQINSSPRSNLQGQIQRNKGNIDYSFLSNLVSYYYFPNKKAKFNRKQIIEIANGLIAKFNDFTSQDTAWIDHQYNNRELQVIMYCFANEITDYDTIINMLERSGVLDPNLFQIVNGTRIRTKLTNELNRLAGGDVDV